jgi:translocation and assembly module TamB
MARWIGRGVKVLGLVLGGVVALALVAVAIFWWWAGTPGSAAWVLRQVARTQPIVAEGVQGSLRSGASVQHIVWKRDGLTVEARDLRVAWKPLDLLSGSLQLDELGAASVRVEDRRPPQPKVVPSSLAIRLRPAVDHFEVGRLEWITGTGDIVATDIAGHYSYTGLQHRLQVDSLHWGAGTFRGNASIGAAGALPVKADVEGRFEAPVPGNPKPVPLDFAVTLLGPLADLQAKGRLQVGTGSPAAGTRATATARITAWGDQPLPQAQAQLHQLDVGALWPQAPHTSLDGELRVQPAGTATWALTAEVANGMPGPWDRQRLPLAKVSAAGEWRTTGEALVRRLHAQVGGGEVQAHGEWRGSSGWEVQGQLTGVDPASLYTVLAAVPVSGKAALQGEGHAIAFDADLKASGTRPRRASNAVDASVQALELRSATAQGRWDDGLLTLRSFDVRTADARLRGALSLRPANWSGDGHASIEAPGLQAQADGAIAPASGKGTLQVKASSFEQALRWLGTLPSVADRLPDLPASGRGDARLSWQGGWRDPAVQARADIPVLAFTHDSAAGALPAGARGWSVRDAVIDVNGRLSAAKVQARGRAEYGDRRLALDLAGQGGRRDGGAWQGQVSALHATAMDPALGAGVWTLTLQRGFDWRWAQAQLEAGAGQALLAPPAPAKGGPAGAPATLAWDPVHWRSGELRTSGRLTGLPMAWIELVGGPQLAGAALSGDMMFDAQWDANLGATPRLQASLVRTRGDITVLAETAEGTSARVPAGVRDARLTLQTDGPAATLSLRWDSERGGTAQGRIATRLVAGGAAGWQWPADAPLTGSLQAHLPRIGVWSLLAPPGWRLRGSLVADVAVAGTRADPQLSGTLAADDLALRSVVDGIELQGGRVRARLAGRAVVIDEFLLHGAPGQGDGGTVRATGEARWTPQGAQAQLTARLDHLRASIRSDRQLTLSGQIAARVDAAGSEVTGHLAIDRALVVLPEQTTPQLGDDVVVRGAATRPTRTQARAAEESGAGARRVRIAIDLDLGNDFRVRGHGIDTRLAGTLSVSGQSLTAPRLTGTIHTRGGEYQAYGQRLDIEHGILRFTGAVENPSLDILAIRPNLTQRVGVQVTGSVLAPYVTLYSEPQLPDAETLSWLVVGRASAAGGAEAALVQQAALALMAGNSGTGKRGVAASLGLDELSFNRTGPSGPAVTLGKRIGRNIYAAYERSLSGALGTLYVFYDLSRRVTVRAEAGSRSAVDLIFTFAFDGRGGKDKPPPAPREPGR